MKKIAIVGFGCSGFNCLKAIREIDKEIEIDVYSNTQASPENPMLTTYFASGKLEENQIFPFGSLEDIISKYKFNFLGGVEVKEIKASIKTVITTDGNAISYDKILLSTGAVAIIPPIQIEGDNIFTVRTYADAYNLKNAVEKGKIKKAVVVGASMAGIKVAELFVKKGIECVLADRATQLFQAACLPQMSDLIEKKTLALGIDLKLGKGLQSVSRLENKLNVTLDDMAIECDAVVLCVGTRADISIIDKEEIKVDKGILVDRYMETSAKDIYAAGDCCQGYDLQMNENRMIGLWANASAQGSCAGKNMAGRVSEFSGEIPYNITHFFDTDFISIGNISLGGEVCTYVNEEKGFTIMALVDGKKINAVNILELYPISGMIKNHIVKSITSQKSEKTDFMNAVMEREGIPIEFITLLGGNSNG